MSASAHPPEALHATAIVAGEAGVVIRGASGAGKSALALALVAAARQAGAFARLVGDDRLLLSVANGLLIARPHPAIAGRVERRGQGIGAVEHEAGVVVRCVIDLVASGPPGSDVPPRLPSEAERRARLAEVSLPRLVLRVGDPAPEAARRAWAFVQELPPRPRAAPAARPTS
ncbi:MAG TPA: aldolase [Beijerinckiaceae bacterium]|jgi:serine kinase of HPr protein (carbohydrate metabolism regulator)